MAAEKSFQDDAIVLNYHDAILYGSDLKRLEIETEWLNDACIHFFFTQLTRKKDSYRKNSFLDPSVVSFFMHQCEDEDDVNDFMRNLEGADKIFVPINDQHASTRQRPGSTGTHWSLLVIAVAGSSTHYLHFDSSRGHNRAAVRVVAGKFHQVIGTSHGSLDVQECETPQQNNSYDCGVYMLAATEALAGVQPNPIGLKQSCEYNVKKCLSSSDFAPVLRHRIASSARMLSLDYSRGK